MIRCQFESTGITLLSVGFVKPCQNGKHPFKRDPSNTRQNPHVLEFVEQMSEVLCFSCDGLSEESIFVCCMALMSFHMLRALWLCSWNIEYMVKELDH